MSLAETAKIAVELALTGNFGKGIALAEKELSGFNTTAGRVSGNVGRAEKSTHSFGGALGHASGQLRGLALGPLGLIGITGGLLSFGGAIEASISKVQTFGGEVKRLSALTGLAAETTSALSRAFEHFDVSAGSSEKLIGFLEKNLGNLASRKGAIADFEQKFSLGLTDQNGKLKDANELILTTADYFNNKSIPATTKAAALATLYGRSWQELIPVLAAGRAGIAAAEDSARDLGLTLTTQDLQALKESRRAARDLDDALGGLQVQIGLALLPALDDLAKSATSFVKDNRAGIVEFFRNGAKFAGQLGDAIKNYVLPTFGAIGKAWGAVPEPLKQLLIAGTIGGKVTKFLFDIGPIDIAKALGGGLLQRGSPANPMFVKDVTGGLGGGVPGAAGKGESTIVGALAGTALIAGIAEAFRETIDFRDKRAEIAQQNHLTDIQALAIQLSQMNEDQRTRALRQGAATTFSNAGTDYQTALRSALAGVAAAAGRDTDKLEGGISKTTQAVLDGLPGINRTADGIVKLTAAQSARDRDFSANLKALLHATTAQAGKIAAALTKDILHGAGNVRNTRQGLSELKAARAHTRDPQLIKLLDADISKVTHRLAAREQIAAVLKKDNDLVAAAHKTTATTKSVQHAINVLKADEKAIGSKSHSAAMQIRDKVRDLQSTLRAKKLSVAVTTNVGISLRTFDNYTRVTRSYSGTAVGGK